MKPSVSCLIVVSITMAAAMLLHGETGAELAYTSPVEYPVPGAKLPEKIKAAFAKYLPEQKPENCKWHYTLIEQPIGLNKKTKQSANTQKTRVYITESEPVCLLRAGDVQSPGIVFMMTDQDKEPNVSAIFAENEWHLPPTLLALARELTNANRVQSINVRFGPGGTMAELNFSFLDDVMTCGVKLDGTGKVLEKAKCTQGGYGGME